MISAANSDGLRPTGDQAIIEPVAMTDDIRVMKRLNGEANYRKKVSIV